MGLKRVKCSIFVGKMSMKVVKISIELLEKREIEQN